MCFDDDSIPPEFPGVARRTRSMSYVIRAADGGQFRAAFGEPEAGHIDPDLPAVLVLPDARGLHPYYERVAERLASVGMRALAIDTYGRTAGTSASRPPGFVSGEHSAALRWTHLQTDLAAAVAELRAGEENRRVATLGFCLGGRMSLLAATCENLRLSGAIAFYAGTHGPAKSDLPAPDACAERIYCPGLSIFGGADELIPPEEVDAWRDAVMAARQPQEVVVYPGLPHSFFDRRAGQYREGSTDAAARVMTFLSAIAAR